MSAASRDAIACKPSIGLLGGKPKQHIVDNHVLSREGVPAVKGLLHLTSLHARLGCHTILKKL